MKTAMQEFINELLFIESIKENQITKSNKAILITAVIKQALEKEKEQIIDAANQKIFGDITFTCSDEVITKGENYYNQTYNPVRDESEEAFKHFADNADITITFNRNS
jgi:hypothetical protein